MEEAWRPVIGYEGLYEISNLGRVKSVERYVSYIRTEKHGETHQVTQHVKEHILTQGRRVDGYADVSLSKQGVTILHCVHRLLAEAWIPNPHKYNYVNHIDLDKTNNNLDNLEWISNQGNVLHGVARYSNPQSIPIYCKETDTVYASMGECERALGLSSGSARLIIYKNRESIYTLSLASESQINDAKHQIAAKCSWTFQKQKKGRLHPIRKIKCIETQQVFNTLTEAVKLTKFNEDAIRNSIRRKECCKTLTFYYLDDDIQNEAEYQLQAKANYNNRKHKQQ